MQVALRSNPARFGFFLIIAATIAAIGFWLMTERFADQRELLSIGVSVDIALLIPLFYFIIIRKGTIPKITVVPIFILSLVLAYQIVPTQHQTTLTYIEFLVAPLELTIIGLLIYYVIKIGRDLEQSKGSLRSFPEILKVILEKRGLHGIYANVISSEASLFYYTLAGWSKPHELEENEFTYHQKSGYKTLFILVLFLLPVETFVIHLWLSSFSSTAAWIMTAISIYSLFFVFGDRNSIRHRPISVNEEALQLQIGIRWNTEIPYDQIAKIELREGDETAEQFANLATYGYGNVMLILKEEMTLRGIYGIKKTTDRIALSIDEKDLFVKKVNEKLTL